RAEDATVATDGNGHEAADALELDDATRGWQEVGRRRHVVENHALSIGGHTPDESFAGREQFVDLAQRVGGAAIAAQAELTAVGREQMQARDLVTGHLREDIEGRLENVVDVDRSAQRGGDSVQDDEVPVRFHATYLPGQQIPSTFPLHAEMCQ